MAVERMCGHGTYLSTCREMHGYITGSRAAMNVADYTAGKPEMVTMEFVVKVTVDPERYAEEYGDELDGIRHQIRSMVANDVANWVSAEGTGQDPFFKAFMRTFVERVS